MKLTISSEALKKALSIVQALLPESDVLVSANKDAQLFSIEAGHGGIYMYQSLPATVIEDGTSAFNSSYVTSLYISGDITLDKISDSRIKFTSDKLHGSIEVNQDASRIVALRPEEDFEASTIIPRKMLVQALAKTNFTSTMYDGVRIKLDSHVKVEATDQYRLALCKDELPKKVQDFDALVNPTFIHKVFAKLTDQEVWFGLKDGCVKIATPTFVCFFPMIQTEPQDIETWISELPIETCKGTIETTAEQLLSAVLGASSISAASGNAGYETRVRIRIEGNVLDSVVDSAHGSAESTIKLESSSVSKLAIGLSSKYTVEMLGLIKTGPLKIQFWDDYIVMHSNNGNCVHVIPVVT